MRIMMIAATLAAVALSHAAPATGAAADYPPAFPRAGAHLVLDNAWGSVWDVTYKPGEPTPMHRHQLDAVGIELADSSVTVTTPSGAQQTFPSKHGESYYMPRGDIHVELTPVGYPARHAVIVELKDTAPTVSEPVSGTIFQGQSARKVMESPRVILWDYAWPPTTQGATTLAHNAFIVIIDGGELTGSGPGGRLRSQTVTTGQVFFRPAGATLFEVAAKAPVRAVIVELK